LDNYVTLNTEQTITGLKTFTCKSLNIGDVGVALKLQNSGWKTNIQTALDFYNGNSYTVPNSRISTLMNGAGSAGGTLIFSTQSKGDNNPNTNGLVERMRIDDGGLITITGNLTASGSITVGSLVIPSGNSSHFLKADGSIDANDYATKNLLNNYVDITGD
jgi:hypothetical protein